MIQRLLCFVIGVLVIQQLPQLPQVQWLFLGIPIILILVVRRYWWLAFLLSGMMWAALIATERLNNRLPEVFQGQDIQVEGNIIGLPQQNARRVRFDFSINKSSQLENWPLPKKIRLSWYFPEHKVSAGQYWRFTVRLKKPHGNFNPGGFDYERWLFSHNISATGYVIKLSRPVLLGRKSAWRSISVWRQAIADKLSAQLVQSQSLGVIKALTIGDRNVISQYQWQVFRQTGTSHLVAISGLHIGLVAGLVYLIVLKCWAWTGVLRFSPPKVAALAALLAALMYSALAGFSIPTQRALIMLTVVMAGVYLQRNVRPLNTLVTAMFAVCLLDPLAVLSAGFWLSFLAVTLIVYVLAGRVGKLKYWRSLLKIQWVAAIGLAPLVIFYFQQVSIISPLANLIAVPLISFVIVPLALLSVMLMFFWPSLSAILLSWLDVLIHELLGVLSVLSELPFAALDNSQGAVWVMLLALAGCFLLLAPRGFPGRWLGLVLFLPLLFAGGENLKPGTVKMTLLDVGQGLSAVVQTTKHTLVFDTGAKISSQFDMGSRVLLPFLQTRNIDQIDKLIISHSDNDHIGGAESLLQGIRVDQVISSVSGSLNEFSPTLCRAGQSWQWDDVQFTILAPGEASLKGDNNQSCVLRIATGHGNILLTGDIEKEAEQWLVDEYATKIQAEILVAPHHGSSTSSTLSFLTNVNPEYILIPAGYKNRFGFPHAKVLQNYRKIKAQWFNSADSGALTVLLDENSISVSSFREKDGKYWHR